MDDKELLREIAIQLKKWSHDPTTSGYQHEPMSVLSNTILTHLAKTSKFSNKIIQNIVSRVLKEKDKPRTSYSRIHHRHSRR